MREKKYGEFTPQLPAVVRFFVQVIGLVLLSLLLGLFLQKNKYTLPFDGFLYGLIDKVPHTPFLTAFLSIFDRDFLPVPQHPQFIIILVIIPLIYIFIKRRPDFWWIVLALFIGGVIARVLIYTDTTLVYRERPWNFLPNHVTNQLKEALKSWTSYPSGHTRDTLLIGLTISYFIPKLKYFMIGLALMVGFSRLYDGVHFPTDVLAGLLLGYFAYKISIEAMENIRSRFGKHQGSK